MFLKRLVLVLIWGLIPGAVLGPGTITGAIAEEEHGDEHEEGVVKLSAERQRLAGIEIAAVARRIFNQRIAATGEVALNADRTAHVGPRIAGRIVDIYAFLGDQIAAGQSLLVLDSVELGRARAEFRKARARMELAERTYVREKKLFEEEISSEREMLEAQTANEEARIDYEATEEILHILGMPQKEIDRIGHQQQGSTLVPVPAPFAGTVVEKHAPLGEVVDPSTTLFTIADLSTVWVETQIYEKDLRFVHKGSGASVEVVAYPDEPFEGTVTYLSDLLDETTRTIRVRVEVANATRKLRPGMFAEVRVSVKGQVEVLAVPAEAVLAHEGNWVIYTTQDGEKFEARAVRLGDREDGYVAILDGLRQGERIVVKGGFFIKSEAAKEGFGGGHGH